MNKENERKAQEFLQYVADNEKELKFNLAKNITYDKDIFDDVFSETILKVYNSIIKNGTDVKDFKNYFYISSKWTYALFDNRNKKKQNREIRDYFEKIDIIDENNIDTEAKYNNVINGLDKIRTNLINEFGEENTDLFFKYFKDKTNGGTSYKKLSEELNINSKHLITVINKMKMYVNSEMKEIKDILYMDYACN